MCDSSAKGAAPGSVRWARSRQERDALGGELRGGLLALGDRFAPEQLHKLRIKARRLRNTAELDDLLRGRDSGAAGIFRELQDQLGRIHDRYVVSRWFGAQVVSSRARGQRAVATQAEAERGFFLEASRQLHRKLLAQRPLDLVQAGLSAMGATRLLAASSGDPSCAS